MTKKLAEAIEVLERTPSTITALLSGLSSHWTEGLEGPETWSPYDVVGHLVNAEKSNWLVRLNTILDEGEGKIFDPFDRFAHFETSKGHTLEELLEEFANLRKQNIQILQELGLTEDHFEKVGLHPEFGKVKLGELLATWVVHDLSHIRQIVRTMAKQYETEVGPWKAYLSVFKE